MEKECKSKEGLSQEDHQAASGLLENLPIDIALDILSRLPIRSLIQSKCVCRAWLSLTLDPRLPHMHLSRATESNPCLIFKDLFSDLYELYFVDNDASQGYYKVVTKIDTDSCQGFNKVVTKFDIHPLYGMREFCVVGSCNGLLCLSYSTRLFISNPFAGDVIELPKATRHMNDRVSVSVMLGFGFHPITKEYKVVRFVSYGFTAQHMKSAIEIFTLGTDAWRTKDDEIYPYIGHSQVSVNGALHLVRDRIIVSFDLAEEKFQELPLPDCSGLDGGYCRLLDLGGCLSAAVYCSDEQIEIWVMKDYSVRESWTKEFTIGKHLPWEMTEGFTDPLDPILCLLKNGEILLEYGSGALISYNTESEEFKGLTIQGLPRWFNTFIHVGSLISVEVAIGMQR